MQVVESAAETHLSIVYNCARNYPLPNYYCWYVPWVEILSTWESSSNDGLRITCKLLASAVAEFLDEEHLHFMDMSDSDVSSLLAALASAASSPDSTSQAFGYSYSTSELLSILQYSSRSTANFHKIAKPQVLDTLTSIVLMGQSGQRIAALRLLWGLLEMPGLVNVLKSSHSDFLERLQKEVIGSANEDDTVWSEGILTAATAFYPALETVEGEANHKVAVHYLEKSIAVNVDPKISLICIKSL